MVVLPGRDGAGAVVLIAEGATASCADTNGDGRAGLVRLTVTFRDVKSGDEVVGTLVLRDGHDIADAGEAVLELRGERLSEDLDVVGRWRGRKLPVSR